MKYIALSILFILSSLSLFSYDWNIIADDTDNPNTLYYYSIDSYGKNRYVISGYIYDKAAIKNITFINVSKDSGKTWETKYTCITDPMKGEYPNQIGHIKLLTEKTIIAPLRGGNILKTSNFGDTWDTVKVDTEKYEPARWMSFSDERHGCLLYFFENILWITDDVGDSWQKVDMPVFSEVFPYGFANVVRLSDSVFVGIIMNFSTNEKWIIITKDKCKTWSLHPGFKEYIINQFFANDSVGYAGGQNIYGADSKRPIIYKTTDGGYSWEKVYENYEIVASTYYMDIIDPDNVVVVSFNHVFRTTNGGETWNIESHEHGNPTYFAMRDVAMGSLNEGIIIGRKEYLLSNFLSSATDVQEQEIFNIQVEIFPNPATSQITLSLNDEFISEPEIEIIDYLGNVLEVDYQISTKEVTVNTSTLTPGIYFLRIRSGEQVAAKKFVVVR